MHAVTDIPEHRLLTDNNEYAVSELDERLQKIYSDCDKIAFFVGIKSLPHVNSYSTSRKVLPVTLAIPSPHSISEDPKDFVDDALTFLSICLSSIRASTKPESRVKGCDIALALCEHLSDQIKLDRCLPYFVALFNDESPIVRHAALRSASQLVSFYALEKSNCSFLWYNQLTPQIFT